METVNKTDRRRKIVTLLAFAIMFVVGVTATTVPSTFERISTTFNVSKEYMGAFLFFATFIGFFAASFFSGFLSDLLSKKVVLVGGTVLLALSLFAFSAAMAAFVGVVAMLMVGVSGGVLETNAMLVIVDVQPEKKTKFSNYIQVMFALGAVVGPAFITIMLALGFHWRVIFIIFALLSVALLIFAVRLKIPRTQVSTSEKMRFKDIGKVLSNKMVLVLIATMFLYVWSEIGIASWIKAYFMNDVAVVESWATLMIGLFWSAIGLGRFVAGRFLSHLKEPVILVTACVITLCFQTAFLVFKQPLVATSLVFLQGLSFGLVWPTIVSYAGGIVRRFTGTAIGLIIAFGALGGALSSFIIGVLAHSFGLTAAFVVCPMAVLVNSVIFYYLSLKLKKRNA